MTQPNILYIDIDSQRPDHLGCYGYGRNTSPHIDGLAEKSWLFDRCYVPDAPCLPSRTALFSGRCGWETGVVNHGGRHADPRPEGIGRMFRSTAANTALPQVLRDLGYHTASYSSFAERHSAFHFLAGINEVFNCGGGGFETAEAVVPHACRWIEERERTSPWFLHLNIWDPHTPYRTPDDFGNPFADDVSGLPAWHDETVRQRHWQGCGPRSAQDTFKWIPGRDGIIDDFPRQPANIDSMESYRRFVNGYDTGVAYVDHWLGKVFAKLEELRIDRHTIIVISADHGENLGELNIYGDHQTADHITCCVPCILFWPGVTDESSSGETFSGKVYSGDILATVIDKLGGKIPDNWSFQSFANRNNPNNWQREWLVTSQMAWTCQRGVFFEDYLLLTTFHDGWHDFPKEMLFNIAEDPHQTNDLLAQKECSGVIEKSREILAQWSAEMARRSGVEDPLKVVLQEGGPFHTRETFAPYMKRLRETGRSHLAEKLEANHGK